MTATSLAIILAAGKGTRMKSAKPKVLHPVAGCSMLGHVLAAIDATPETSAAVVVAPEAEEVSAVVAEMARDARVYMQYEQLGTAHAVLAARQALEDHEGPVFVLFGDTPLVRPETLRALRTELEAGAHVAVLGFEAADPAGYGRLLQDSDGNLAAIREHRDCSDEELGVRLCNSGVMGFKLPDLLGMLDRITNDNAKGEFYLTDIVALARGDGFRVRVVTCAEEEVLGINSRVQLAEAEAVYQRRARTAAMENGVTLIAPETVWFSYDTVIGRDVVIEPNVFFGPGVRVADNVHISANCHFEYAYIGEGARVGPFARLRPGAVLNQNVRIGNFVEVKNSVIGTGAKANHLAYLGDADVGDGANVGAGTIICNYDGFKKYRTTIEAGAFIGSNSSLVAPVKIGADAYVGSGSVITKTVPAGALSLERAEQVVRDGWAARFREKMKARKG
ncbi:MAG: bifunctional UDP-N-acetylglucosamine diphosphorylase/glucosamine-1-phosphate N-acetyltransferase GlmU [Pseudomonadota bacterium]